MQPWGSVIPEKLSLIITSMEAHSGDYKLNPLYLSHLQFEDGQSWQSLGLTGHETYDIVVDDNLTPLQKVDVTATDSDGNVKKFTAIVSR